MPTLIDRAVNWALAACLAVMSCVVFGGVLFRYLLNMPLTWTEELASLLFAWITFVGAYVGFRTRAHIAIDSFMILVPRQVREATARLADLVIVALLGLFVWQGLKLTLATWSLEFPAMEISRGYLYLSLPVGAALMILAVLAAWRDRRLGRLPGEAREDVRP